VSTIKPLTCSREASEAHEQPKNAPGDLVHASAALLPEAATTSTPALKAASTALFSAASRGPVSARVAIFFVSGELATTLRAAMTVEASMKPAASMTRAEWMDAPAATPTVSPAAMPAARRGGGEGEGQHTVHRRACRSMRWGFFRPGAPRMPHTRRLTSCCDTWCSSHSSALTLVCAVAVGVGRAAALHVVGCERAASKLGVVELHTRVDDEDVDLWWLVVG
jgi:hypothetical protein